MPIDTAPAVQPKAPARKIPAKPPAPPRPADKTASRRENLDGILKIVSYACVMRGQYADAGAFSQHGPGVATEVASLAETNEKIASWVDYLSEAGPYMGLAVATLPLVMQILANHGRLDVDKLPPDSGIIEPALLERKVRADMLNARRAMEAQIAESERASMNGAEG
jgi:hypothetical protein